MNYFQPISSFICFKCRGLVLSTSKVAKIVLSFFFQQQAEMFLVDAKRYSIDILWSKYEFILVATFDFFVKSVKVLFFRDICVLMRQHRQGDQLPNSMRISIFLPSNCALLRWSITIVYLSFLTSFVSLSCVVCRDKKETVSVPFANSLSPSQMFVKPEQLSYLICVA